MPIQLRVATAPCCATAQFVAQVRSHGPWLAPVTAYNRLLVRGPLRLGIIAVVPETVAVRVAAEPICTAQMVIEDYHDVCVRQRGDHGNHHLHRALSFELRIGLHGLVRHPRIAFERLVGPRQPNRVHPDLLDLPDNCLHWSVIQASSHVFLFIESEPIHRCGPDRMSIGGQNLIAAGVQGWLDLIALTTR